MKNYRVNRNTDSNPGNNNEVHSEGCHLYINLVNFEDLGRHANCYMAVSAAKLKGYSSADGCRICSPECHRG